ncbi:2373ac8b-865e-42db-9aea-8fe972c4a185 [Sclerotinia trifoliorum]|uniref:2373ac8b-865e-42db-9aea-8fe972c4a185 n=1 Tax=Sclerotinia trifoliorum TaxID=28548 RepID=A0A8H2W115_9HELO|nr:2373ac8b-865e-42db-9aea-8fe972c4a185 [Sclerotinia trifoliorum]
MDSRIVFTKRLLPANEIRNFPTGFRGQRNTNKTKFMLYKDGFTGSIHDTSTFQQDPFVKSKPLSCYHSL